MSADVENALRDLMRDVLREELRLALNEQHASCANVSVHVEDKPLWSVQRAAQHASVDEATIRTWIRKGLLPSHRAGRHLRVDQDELRVFLSRQSEHSSTKNLRQQARNFVMKTNTR